MTRTTKTAKIALTLALAAMLVLPTTVAFAAPRASGSQPSNPTAVAQTGADAPLGAQRGDIVRERVRNALRRRKGLFDTALAAIERRIERTAALGDRTGDAGGDVAHVQELLDSAREALAEAKELESEAADEFNAVPGSSTPRAAFADARSTAHDAVLKLREARTYLRDANVELRSIVKALLDAAEDA